MNSDLVQIGWVLHLEPDGGNDAFWWLDAYPEAPADGAVPVFRPRQPHDDE